MDKKGEKNQDKSKFIAGTNILKPRQQMPKEKDVDYIKYLNAYYEGILAGINANRNSKVRIDIVNENKKGE